MTDTTPAVRFHFLDGRIFECSAAAALLECREHYGCVTDWTLRRYGITDAHDRAVILELAASGNVPHPDRPARRIA